MRKKESKVEKPKRAIRTSVRFEVLKRDKYTCQYCGKSAPNVELEVDHIIPVSKGGSNDILNLITSCKECNIGKNARLLNDNTVMESQIKTAKKEIVNVEKFEKFANDKKKILELNEERLLFFVDEINVFLGEGRGLTENGISKIRYLVNKYKDDDFIYEAIIDSYNAYSRDGSDKDMENFINKIQPIAYINSQPEHIQEAYRLKYTAKKCLGYVDEKKFMILLSYYYKKFNDYDEIRDGLFESRFKNFTELKNFINEKLEYNG